MPLRRDRTAGDTPFLLPPRREQRLMPHIAVLAVPPFLRLCNCRVMVVALGSP